MLINKPRYIKSLKIQGFYSIISILLILTLVLWYQFNNKHWEKNRIIEWDVNLYYSYLPATFIYKDITLQFKNSDPNLSHWFWTYKAPNGNYVIKMTMGLSFLYSPFFFMANALAKPLGYEQSGFSEPYRLAISLAGVFYLLLGLILLRKILLRYFSDVTCAITLLLLVLATNLFWYSTREPGMAHVYSFFLFALFLFLLEKWLQKPNWLNSIFFGFVCGLIALIRPTNTLIGLLFLLWGVSGFSEIKQRVKLLIKQWYLLLLMIVFALLVWVPQMLYWKMQTGSYFYNSYGGESFFFMPSKIFLGLFSYQKGWFIYTPIMFLAFAGFPILNRYKNGISSGILVFILANICIIFSWWCWWYGGGYGARSMIESYALMAFPLAALVHFSLSQVVWRRIMLLLLFTILLAHGFFQNFQYHYGAIHWDSMTKEAYWLSFGRLKKHPELPLYLRSPNYPLAVKGQYAYHSPKVKGLKLKLQCDFEQVSNDSTAFVANNDTVKIGSFHWRYTDDAKAGNYSLYTDNNKRLACNTRFQVKPNHFYLVEVWKKGKTEDVYLVAQTVGSKKFYQTNRYITARGKDGWKRIALSFTVPANLEDNMLEIYVQNNSKKKVLFDELVIYEELKE